MRDLNQCFNVGRFGSMSVFVMIAFLVFLLSSCADTSINPDKLSSETEEVSLSERFSPNSVLTNLNFQTKLDYSSGKTKAHTGGGEFASPLFGLETAPNGDILVADAGAGVATLDGSTSISLPGITDMSPLGRNSMWAIKGLTGNPGEDTGQALYMVSKGKNRVIADLYAFEEKMNPDGIEGPDSNPFDVHSLGGDAALVADAGGNDLLRVDNQGNISVLAVLPNELVSTDNIKNLVGCPESGAELCGLPDMIPAQPVATSIAVGPDGYYYVGELKGFPAPTGESNVWKISPDASWADCGSNSDECMKLFDGGFTSIIDLKFDSKGNLHVVELDEQSWFAVEILSPGALQGGTINSCDLDTNSCKEVATGIPILTAITFGNNGSLWATENALIPGSADVIEIK